MTCFSSGGGVVPSIINRAVCFVTRTDTVIVLNGDQSLFPGMDMN